MRRYFHSFDCTFFFVFYLEHHARVGANVNVMMKTMGYFSHQLSKDEKSFFMRSLEKYKAGRLPSSASLSV